MIIHLLVLKNLIEKLFLFLIKVMVWEGISFFTYLFFLNYKIDLKLINIIKKNDISR